VSIFLIIGLRFGEQGMTCSGLKLSLEDQLDKGWFGGYGGVEVWLYDFGFERF